MLSCNNSIFNPLYTKPCLTVPLWLFFALSQTFLSFLFLSAPEASCCPGPPEHTALDNPDKRPAAASEGLAESSCPTNAARPLRLSKAPSQQKRSTQVTQSSFNSPSCFKLVGFTHNMAQTAALVDQLL